MSKRSTPITNETCILKKARIQCELANQRYEEANQRYEEANQRYEEIKAMIQEKRDREIARIMADLTEKQYRAVHKMQWSRIEAGFGICVDDNGADEFYVYVGLHEGYRFREEKWRTFKMADWAVHTNYPRDPLDFEDF
jgi:hypothetical protein